MLVTGGEFAVGLVEFAFLDFEIGDLFVQRGVGDGELLIEALGLGGEMVVPDDELVAVDRVLDGGGEFFTQPGLGDEAENFALVDRVDDGGERENGGDEDARAEGAQFFAFDEEIEAEHLGHALVGDDDGKFAFT